MQLGRKERIMIMIEGYSLCYYPKENRIIISLPQTEETIESTMYIPVDRRVAVSHRELIPVLEKVVDIFERKEP